MSFANVIRCLHRGQKHKVFTTKDGDKSYKMKKGDGYIVEPWRVRQYIVPDLSDFKLTPYVSPKADKYVRVPEAKPIDYFSTENPPEGLDPAILDGCRKRCEEAFVRFRTKKHTGNQYQARLKKTKQWQEYYGWSDELKKFEEVNVKLTREADKAREKAARAAERAAAELAERQRMALEA
ncbi:hypothetical protein HK104_000989 [Borealophlyctis nickersoniae]|nr:hypothetical protein HK104_000989 [Borealophlyctis nickersoniae]